MQYSVQYKDAAGVTSKENELILCCARTHLEPKTRDRLSFLLRQELDWPGLIRTAHTHHVLPLLYANLCTSNPDAVPKVSLEQIKDYYRQNVQHSFFLCAELLKLMKLFQTHQIKAIPFKGPVLAASAYQDLTLRQFSDLDILVEKRHIIEAGRLLVTEGYQPDSRASFDVHNDLDHDEVAFLGPKYYAFFKTERQIRVDLQWRLTESYFSFSLDRKELWQRLVPVSIAGATVLTFPPADMLLILCVHGSKHQWNQLKWICDIAELLRVYKEQIDWEQTWNEASRHGAERMFGLGLYLAHELLGTDLPKEVFERTPADRVTKSLVRQIGDRLFAQANDSSGAFAQIIFYLRMKDRWQERLQFCVSYLTQFLRKAFIPTSRDEQLLRLPAAFFLLYYFLRPLRLTLEHGRSVLTRHYKPRQSRT